jgi:hypothetical protein
MTMHATEKTFRTREMTVKKHCHFEEEEEGKNKRRLE